MIKNFIVSCCLIFSVAAVAQQRNASPYSYYGVGDVKFKGTAENRAMGGLGILPDSTHINLQNPASYSSLIFTTFTIGGSTGYTKFKNDAADQSAYRTTLDFLAVGLPIGKKMGFAIGMMPYSDVGYKIDNYTTVDGVERFRRFEGSGGLNKVFAGFSYQITPELSAGIDGQYYFGTIETKSITAIPDIGLQYPTREVNSSDYHGFAANIGLMYKTKLNNYDWFTSATYTPQVSLGGNTERQFATITYSSAGGEIIVDEVNTTLSNDDVKLPSKFSFGTGFGDKTKWFAGLQYTYQQENSLGNRFDNVTDAGFEAAHRMTLGGYYTPKYQSYNSYLSRITYRAGLKYEKTGLVVNTESINDLSATLGLGLPLGSYASSINFGVELGQRGTTSSGLIQENYRNFFISLSLSDRWFVKRKYD